MLTHKCTQRHQFTVRYIPRDVPLNKFHTILVLLEQNYLTWCLRETMSVFCKLTSIIMLCFCFYFKITVLDTYKVESNK